MFSDARSASFRRLYHLEHICRQQLAVEVVGKIPHPSLHLAYVAGSEQRGEFLLEVIEILRLETESCPVLADDVLSLAFPLP